MAMESDIERRIMTEQITVTLVMQGMKPSPDTTQQAEFLKFRNGAAIIRGWDGRQERYSLKSGKRLGTNWDFWRLSFEDVKRLRKMKYEMKTRGEL